jgi:hypothetical protein
MLKRGDSMAIGMNTLAGFMRIGPQTFPDRPNAVQVIERGPHGKRLAADPVTVRLGQPRGSGFRFWVEQLNVPADESWNPPQRIVGLMGLGSQPQSALSRAVGVMRRHNIQPGVVCALDNTQGPLFQKIAAEAFPDGGSIDAGIAELRGIVNQVKGIGPVADSAQAMACLMRWQAGTVGGSKASGRRENINALHTLIIARRGEKREDGKPMINPRAYDHETGEVVRPSVVGTFVRSIPESLEERSREVFGGEGKGLCSREQLRVPLFGSMMCSGVGKPRTLFKNPLVTAAVFAGGALLLYGVARGIGGAIVGGR